jgi:hypothetical protein
MGKIGVCPVSVNNKKTGGKSKHGNNGRKWTKKRA